MISFAVLGKPAPAGSKRGFFNQKAQRVILTDDSKHSRPWKALVTDAAPDIEQLLTGPLTLSVTFYFPRPKSHYRTGKHAGELRINAPLYPTGKPDTTKLVRAVEDALTSVIWRDDAQVVNQWARKMYGEPARCEIEIHQLNDLEEAA